MLKHYSIYPVKYIFKIGSSGMFDIVKYIINFKFYIIFESLLINILK